MTPSTDKNVLDVPPPLRRVYEWWKALFVPATVLAALAGYFFGPDVGWVVAALCVGFLVVLHVLIFFTGRNLRATDLAEKFLSTSDYTNAEERQKALRELRSAKRSAKVLFGFLFLVAAAAIVLLLYQPIYRILRTKPPKTVEFESIQYFDPTRDSGLFQQSPFLEAVVTYLTDEAKAEDRTTRILLGTTKAFVHPTPAVAIAISVDDPEHVITGYAFRQHRTQGRLLYEPLPLRYSRSGPVAFLLPACDPDDRVFFLGRLSLPHKGDPFPENLPEVMKFLVVEAQR